MLTEGLDIVAHPGHFAIAEFQISVCVLADRGFGPIWILAKFRFGPLLGFGSDLVSTKLGSGHFGFGLDLGLSLV